MMGKGQYGDLKEGTFHFLVIVQECKFNVKESHAKAMLLSVILVFLSIHEMYINRRIA